MAGIGERHHAVGIDAEHHAGGAYVLPLAHLIVHALQDQLGRDSMLHFGADGADNQGHQHPRLDALAGYVSQHNRDASLRLPGNDLKEVSADLARGPVLALDSESGDHRQFFGNQYLLHIPGLLDLQLPLLFLALRMQEPPGNHYRYQQQ